MRCYLESLDGANKMKVKCEPGTKIFTFGSGEQLQSTAAYTIPAVLAGHDITIKTDAVDYELPLLLSLNSMKRANVKLDVEHVP